MHSGADTPEYSERSDPAKLPIAYEGAHIDINHI